MVTDGHYGMTVSNHFCPMVFLRLMPVQRTFLGLEDVCDVTL